MRLFSIIFSLVLLVSCSKDKFTREPQIKFEGFTSNNFVSPIFDENQAPRLILKVTDGDGDIGIDPGRDTAFIHMKNLLTGDSTSLMFPNLGSAAKKNFEAEVEASIFRVMRGDPPAAPRPWIDTLFFEVYITDFDKNKSNVIVTPEPFFLIFP